MMLLLQIPILLVVVLPLLLLLLQVLLLLPMLFPVDVRTCTRAAASRARAIVRLCALRSRCMSVKGRDPPMVLPIVVLLRGSAGGRVRSCAAASRARALVLLRALRSR
jgi:hypothetical protein